MCQHFICHPIKSVMTWNVSRSVSKQYIVDANDAEHSNQKKCDFLFNYKLRFMGEIYESGLRVSKQQVFLIHLLSLNEQSCKSNYYKRSLYLYSSNQITK